MMAHIEAPELLPVDFKGDLELSPPAPPLMVHAVTEPAMPKMRMAHTEPVPGLRSSLCKQEAGQSASPPGSNGAFRPMTVEEAKDVPDETLNVGFVMVGDDLYGDDDDLYGDDEDPVEECAGMVYLDCGKDEAESNSDHSGTDVSAMP